MSEETVRVLVRCRPINTREKNLSCKMVVKMDSSMGQVKLSKPNSDAAPKVFTFDGAYYIDSTSETIYEDCAFPLVDSVLEGFNATVFAYGQTGCGKSFTMEGIPDPPQHRGITPRSFEHIFQEVQVRDNTRFLVRASYLEIYNEMVRDLLNPKGLNLDLREDPNKGVYVQGLSMHEVKSAKELIKVMAKGTQQRSVGATAMNADSSRSHSIFTVWVEMCETSDDSQDKIRAGKLNLVDLAGSERQSKTQAEGARLKEATKINLSLSALGNVISALVDGKSKHIPYRDSKLTRLLQDSLGGNTKTLMIAAISPADNNYDETLSTLRYANRAKNIMNKAKINEDPKDALLREYQEEITKLKAMLAGKVPLQEPNSSPQATKQYNEEKLRLQMEEKKRSEVQEIEAKLQEEYDNKLAELEARFGQNADPDKLEEEFTRITEDYETKKANIQVSGVSENSTGGLGGRTTAVIGKDGEPLIALALPDGRYIKTKLDDDGQLRPLLDQDGNSIEVVGATELPIQHENNNKSGGMNFVPSTVIDAEGNQVAALIGPDGRPVVAKINPQGQLEPETDENGNFKYMEERNMEGGSSQGSDSIQPGSASTLGFQSSFEPLALNTVRIVEQVRVHVPVVAMSKDGMVQPGVLCEEGIIACGKLLEDGTFQAICDEIDGSPIPLKSVDNSPVFRCKSGCTPVIVSGPDDLEIGCAWFNGQFARAEVDVNGVLRPIMDSNNEPELIKYANGDPREVLPAARIDTGEHLSLFTSAVAIGPTGAIIPSVLGANGNPLKATNETRGLEPVRDDKNQTQAVYGPSGNIELITSPCKPVCLLDKSTGEVVVGVENAEGKFCKAKLDSASGELQAIVGADGWPHELDDVTLLNPSVSIMQQSLPKLSAVLGQDGLPTPALFGASGVPIEARVSQEGKVEAVRDEHGQLIVVKGPNGSPAERVQASNSLVVKDQQENLVVSVTLPDQQVARAKVGEDGMLQAAQDASGQYEIVNRASEPKTLKMAGRMDQMVVVNDGGQAVPVFLDADGSHLKLGLNRLGVLETMHDAKGRKVRLKGQASGIKLKPILEESPMNENTIPDDARETPLSPDIDDAILEQKLKEKLEQLQANTIGANGGESQEKEKVKEELKRKKSRAERRRRERLRKAAENAEDDGILEEIYENMADEIKGTRDKLRKAKEALKAARQETIDLNVEFERERQDMLEDIRKQAQQIKYQAAVLEKIQPLVRRDCNYFNLDKIKSQSVWDEDSQQWTLPPVTTARGGSAASMDENWNKNEDEQLRKRLDKPRDSKYFQSKRAEQLLGSLGAREQQIKEEMQSRAARFNANGPPTSERSKQLLKEARSHRKGRNPPALGPLRQRGPGGEHFTEDDWL
eukprot:m.82575 g.82575  ORF g.82575 m.82575 type:complete len:1374 (+) comp12876_c0_seq2:187-4308(+)